MKQINFNSSKNVHQKQGGFTLIELLIVIMISLIVIAGIFAIKAEIDTKLNVSDAVTEINEIRDGIQYLYSQDSAYTGLTNNDVVAGKMINSGYITGQILFTPWRIIEGANSTITVAPATPNTQFTITVDNIPSDACQSLSATYIGKSNLMSINGTATTVSSDISTNCGLRNPATLILTFV